VSNSESVRYLKWRRLSGLLVGQVVDVVAVAAAAAVAVAVVVAAAVATAAVAADVLSDPELAWRQDVVAEAMIL
jgi:hypothetical protein